MVHFVGLDVSVKETSVCVVDDAGKVILEQKVLTEPTVKISRHRLPSCCNSCCMEKPGTRRKWRSTARSDVRK